MRLKKLKRILIVKNDKTLLEKIDTSNDIIENKFNKIEEWIIPRDRSSFYLTHDYHSYFAAFPPQLVFKLLDFHQITRLSSNYSSTRLPSNY